LHRLLVKGALSLVKVKSPGIECQLILNRIEGDGLDLPTRCSLTSKTVLL
jgi:hypothetical protein